MARGLSHKLSGHKWPHQPCLDFGGAPHGIPGDSLVLSSGLHAVVRTSVTGMINDEQSTKAAGKFPKTSLERYGLWWS